MVMDKNWVATDAVSSLVTAMLSRAPTGTINCVAEEISPLMVVDARVLQGREVFMMVGWNEF